MHATAGCQAHVQAATLARTWSDCRGLIIPDQLRIRCRVEQQWLRTCHICRQSATSPAILDKMRSAGTPPRFTTEFLKSTLGFTASQDRAFPRMLKQLGFLTPDGTPLPRYNEYKSATTGGRALAQGLREGWASLYLADQTAHTRSAGELTETFKTVTGQGEAVAKKMASTFKAFAAKADWSGPAPADDGAKDAPLADEDVGSQGGAGTGTRDRSPLSLHHDVHVHLPPTSDVAVYRAIFRAMREDLL
jgi:hypothetical protein